MPTRSTTPDEQAPAQQDQHDGKPAQPGVPLAPPGIAPESDVRTHTPASAAPQPSHGLVPEGLGELPRNYGDGRLVALIRDPETLYVYWDFSQQQIEQAFAGLGSSRAMLKLWNSRSGADLVREAEVHLEVRGWYVRDLPPATELRVELWAVGEKGTRMMRAGRPVRLPPSIPSDQLEAFYMTIPLDQSLREGLARHRPLQYGGSAPTEWDRRLQPRSAELPASRGGPSGGGPYASGGYPSSPTGKLPWSMTHVPDLDKDS
jgi:hypothetical protein